MSLQILGALLSGEPIDRTNRQPFVGNPTPLLTFFSLELKNILPFRRWALAVKGAFTRLYTLYSYKARRLYLYIFNDEKKEDLVFINGCIERETVRSIMIVLAGLLFLVMLFVVDLLRIYIEG